MLTGFVPSSEKLMEAIHSTMLENVLNMAMAARKLKNFRHWMVDKNEGINAQLALNQAREACISVFGRQSEYFLNAFILMHSNGLHRYGTITIFSINECFKRTPKLPWIV